MSLRRYKMFSLKDKFKRQEEFRLAEIEKIAKKKAKREDKSSEAEEKVVTIKSKKK